MDHRNRTVGLASLIASLVAAAVMTPPSPAAAESGYQVIQGTRVFTVIDHDADTATFSNECGSQTISHRDLGNGAIPDRIIPCPRPGAAAPTRAPTTASPGADDPEGEPGEAAGIPDRPSGSYAQTCMRCQQGSSGITCQCRRVDQSYRTTSIDPTRCVGGEVENLDGRLSCTRGTTTAHVRSPGGTGSNPYAWVSVAAGIQRFSARTEVSTGYARGRTSDEARDAAVEACAKSGSVSTCRAVGAWSRTCVYITTSEDNNGGDVAWGSGGTPQIAYNNCLSHAGGGTCDTHAIGGCAE